MQRITAHMDKVLPAIAAELEALGPQARRSFASTSSTRWPAKYGVQHIYFIDRAHKVFQTNLASDMNLAFPEGEFTRVPRFGVRRQQGDERRHRPVSQSPARSGPTATSAPRERLHHRDLDRCPRQPRRGRFRLDEQVLLRGLVLRRGPLQPLRQGRRHLPGQRRRHLVAAPCRQEARSGAGRARHQEPPRGSRGGDGRYLTIYSGEQTAAATDPGHPVSSKLVIRKITYDTGLAREAVIQVFLSSMIVLALLLPLVFWIASRLLQKQLLDPAVQPARRGRRHRRGRPRPGHRQHRPARRDRPARQELRLDARRGAQDDPRPQGHQHLDRALRAARLPGDRRQAVDRRGRAGRQQAREHDHPVLRHPELHDPVGEA